MIYELGPKAQHVYWSLHLRLSELRPGSRLPTLRELVAEFGVAPLTIRQVLAKLEEEGRLSREQGRGTFVREPAIPAVLIVDDDRANRVFLATHVGRLGYRSIEAAGPDAGLAALASDHTIGLVLSDVHMPLRDDGIAFIRAVRQGWPRLPLAAVTAYPDDLIPLHGTADCPVLIVPKPVWASYIEQVLRLTMPDQLGTGKEPASAGIDRRAALAAGAVRTP